MSLQFRLDVFDFFNHPNFNAPVGRRQDVQHFLELRLNHQRARSARHAVFVAAGVLADGSGVAVANRKNGMRKALSELSATADFIIWVWRNSDRRQSLLRMRGNSDGARAIFADGADRKEVIVGRNTLQHKFSRCFSEAVDLPSRAGGFAPENFKSRTIRIVARGQFDFCVGRDPAGEN